MTKCGYVSVVGRPNAGKSSFLIHLLVKKLRWFHIRANATKKRIKYYCNAQ